MEEKEKLQVEFEVEKTDDHWQEYNIAEKYLNYEGITTKYKGIIKNNKLAALVSKRYTVIPNELLKEEIVPLIEQFGYQQLDSPAKPISENRYLQYFIDPKLHNIGNDTIKLGLLLRNSIDGSISLGLEGFTYRTLCSNGMIAGKGTVYSFTKKHMGDAKEILNGLEEGVALVNKSLLQVLEKYDHLMRKRFETNQYNQLKDALPKKLIIGTVKFLNTGTEWQAFNEVSANVWHNHKINQSRQYSSMQVINRVFEI